MGKLMYEWYKGFIWLLVALLIGVGAYMWCTHRNLRNPVVIPYADTTNAQVLQDKLKITSEAATDLSGKIEKIHEGVTKPDISYDVIADTVEAAEVKTVASIKSKDPAIPALAKEDTDRTVVTHDTQKVDVYKINTAPKVLHSVALGTSKFHSLDSIEYGIDKRLSDKGRYIGVAVEYVIPDKRTLFKVRGTF